MDERNDALYVKIYSHAIERIVFKSIRDVVKEMVAAQMPISFEIEALKAQAVIARTAIVRKMRLFGGNGCSKYNEADFCDDGHCGSWAPMEVLREQWGSDFEEMWKKITIAEEETKDQIITLNNKVIDPRFHAACGGSTENSEKVEDNRILYLRKVLCEYCKDSPYWNHSMEMTLEEIETKLNVSILDYSPKEGPQIEGVIENIVRDEEGRVVRLRIAGKEFKGTEVMELLGLNSTRFGWKPVAFKFETQGKGDGLGLCQYGANKMAAEGKTAEEILKYYYTGIQTKQYEKPSIHKPLNGKIIVVDPGHGGDNMEDSVGPTGLREKDVNLSISKILVKILREAGATVYETRSEDVYIPLSKRAALANEVRPHFFLSIHQNSFPNAYISGTEIYYYRGDKDGEALGELIARALSESLGTVERGAKVADFYLLREVKSPAIQIEVGYITNAEEEIKMKDDSYHEKAAKAIVDALTRYYSYN
ncbi:MAG: stage II sporulation protein D [Bacillota bacterium]